MKIGVTISIVVAVVVLVVALAGVGFLVSNQSGQDKSMINNTDTSIVNETTQGIDNFKTVTIEITGFQFVPATVRVNKGDTVIWVNKDELSHTVTSDSGNELKSNIFSKGGSYFHVFSESGTYPYHCELHPTIKGTIIVD